MVDDERPFFLLLNYMDAHDPYYVERGCEGQGYAAAIRCLDRRLAPVVGWRSLRRPTVFVLLSDHGEQFGEHGLVRHGNSLFVQLLHVPLMIRGSGVPEKPSIAMPVSIAALPALLDSAGAAPLTDPVVALLHPPAAAKQPSQWSALDGTWHLIVSEDGSTALFDLARDPLEERNVANHAPTDAALARLQAAIQAMRRSPKPELRRFRSLGYLH
jgi:arylsulfatase A-like enzyme